MATVGGLALRNTGLRGDALAHAQRLLASWQTLADLSFSDLLLLAPVQGEEGRRFVVFGQVRPTTGQTLYPADMVGMVVDEVERPLMSHAWRQGEVLIGGGTVLGTKERARVQCIPVRHRGSMIALVTRESSTESGRRHGELERNYLATFDRFATMVAEGSFPFGRDEVPYGDTPRVGDGAIVLDGELNIVFASPNAVSSLHRMGIHAYTKGLQLSELGFEQGAIDTAIRARLPVDEELEPGDTSFTLRAIPLLEADKPVGAIVLLRDVTDLRSRDRMLLSKDATIREIHHRVKNNLQTIAALLRLQGRRLKSGEAQEAIDDSERRIRSIAIVHETLSRDTRDVVSFDDVIRPLVRVVEETVSTPDVRLVFDVEGDAGDLSGDVATPLAVVLNELMQNAVDHAFPRDGEGSAKGHVQVRLAREERELVVDVVDDGVGLPAGFTLEDGSGLGLSIVQALVKGELGGSIVLRDENGTRAHVRVPLAPVAPVDL
ncbi:MAG: sensor histidine kinase [Actinobacteria bacterium]|nr:sensor histidine kinase [Actinomycetota bacterium]